MLEKTVESPLDCKEIKPVHPKENQSWIFIGRTDAEAEAPILWLPDAKSWFIRKDPDAGKDLRQEEKGMTEDEMFGWRHQLSGYEFEHWEMVNDGEAWQAAVHGVTKSQTWLCSWTTRLQYARLLCPWDSLGKNTGVGCYFLFPGIFWTQGPNPHLLHLLHWKASSLPLAPSGKPHLID